MAEPVSLQVPAAVIKDVVEERIRIAVIEAMSGTEGFVDAVVAKTLSMKCDNNGKLSSYERDNCHTFLSVVCAEAIRKATIAAVETWAKANEKAIQKALEKAMKNSTSSICKQLMASLLETAKNRWAFKIDIEGKG